MFVLISFINIQYWYKYAYLFYLFVLLLLIAVDLFGITASNSKRWISLYVFNLQPSELMKVGLIIFLARYYSKIPLNDVSHIKFIILPILALTIPVGLTLGQPDLGTALLIALGGFVVIWLSGFKLKFFLI